MTASLNSAGVAVSLNCECRHPKSLHHEGFDDCGGPECDCTEFRREGSRVLVAGGLLSHVDAIKHVDPDDDDDNAPPVHRGHIDKLLEQARRNPSKRIQSLGQKIAALAADLEERLTFDGERAKAQAEIDRLEAALSAAKARLRGGTIQAVPAAAPKRAVAYGDFPCADCPKTATTAAGLSAHRRFAHPAMQS